MEVVKRVGAHKDSNGEKFLIRSAREADMIKALTKKAGKNLPKSLIVDIWRKLITAANMSEQPLQIASCHPENEQLIRGYYNSKIPISHFKNAKDVIDALKNNQAQIGIFALPPHQKDEWWKMLGSDLKVFAQIPFDEKSKIKLLAVAAKEPEESEEDITLISTKNGLTELDGFHLESELGDVVGHYAKPLV